MADLTGPRPNPRARLRALLEAAVSSGEPLVAPGCYDALSARLVEQAGFDAAYMTGFGTSASLLGRPDVGLATATEMTDNARRIAATIDLPLIADADTGYGNPVNVARTVREMEQAGVGALQLEDQVSPKRCGHMTGKEVIATAEMCAKVAAAVAARTDPDLVVIARTDAAETQGTAAAVERARAFRDAGADVLFVEAPRTAADVELVARELAGTPLLFNWVEGGRTQALSLQQVRELGFALVLFPVSTLMAATRAMTRVLTTLRTTGSTEGEPLTGFEDFLDVVDLAGVRAVEARFTA